MAMNVNVILKKSQLQSGLDEGPGGGGGGGGRRHSLIWPQY